MLSLACSMMTIRASQVSWGGGDDLIGRQDEAVATGVPQLEGVGVLDALVVGPVDGRRRSLGRWCR
uniref:Uncharacterized protein n=1 Tax=Anguilla anguilla TaxID=7936 RepID=A0A0E9UWM9_ANGAN